MRARARPIPPVALDEPELHLHPRLLQRALALFEETSASQPVIRTTHSRRLLDLLNDPTTSAVVLQVAGSPPTTTLLRPDPEALRAWLDVYDGLGRVTRHAQYSPPPKHGSPHRFASISRRSFDTSACPQSAA